MKTDQEKLVEYFHQWQNHENAVTRSAYRDMALSVYFDLYIISDRTQMERSIWPGKWEN